jgi:hypothetical protein
MEEAGRQETRRLEKDFWKTRTICTTPARRSLTKPARRSAGGPNLPAEGAAPKATGVACSMDAHPLGFRFTTKRAYCPRAEPSAPHVSAV